MATDPEDLLNAFTRAYLDAVREEDEPATAIEAETSEPWVLKEEACRFGLFRPWESFAKGDVPLGLFHLQEIGLLFRAIWPALGKDGVFRLRETPTEEGYAVQVADETVAHLRRFHPEAVFAANLGSYLLRSPYALALIVWLAGPAAQREIGRVLAALASDGALEDGAGAPGAV
jgi:hypothetical protein